MDKSLKRLDIACIVLFGALGTFALGAALFAGAKHQFVMAVICAAMVAAAIAEIRHEERMSGREFRFRARAIRKQLAAAILRRYYPAACIPMRLWVWRWDRRGDVKYRHWRTLWNYITSI